MAAAHPINFWEITSALLHTQIEVQFGRGFGCGSNKVAFLKNGKMTFYWQNDKMAKFVPNLDWKKYVILN